MHFWSLVAAQGVGIDAGAQPVALGVPFGEQCFVFGGALAGLLFFFLDLGSLSLENGLGGFHVLVARLGIHHHLEDLVLVGADLLLSELDLVHQRFVLVVGLDGQRLVAELGDLALQVEDVGFVLLAGGLVGFGGGLGFLEFGPGGGQLFFNRGHAFGQCRNLFPQAQDFLVRNLQLLEVFEVLQHGMLSF